LENKSYWTLITVLLRIIGLKSKESAIKKLRSGWIDQFDKFCYEMEIGDIVIVLDGQKYVLGVASITKNQHEYSKKLREEGSFFDHIRSC